jgi:hypothetical protein
MEKPMKDNGKMVCSTARESTSGLIDLAMTAILNKVTKME